VAATPEAPAPFPRTLKLGKLASNFTETTAVQSMNSTPLGIMEGFFGRPWSWQARTDYAHFLAAGGYHFYLYAPKSDACLRRSWEQDWSSSEWAELKALREAYRQHRIDFGIGLSPFEIYLEPGDRSRRKLRAKIAALNQLYPTMTSDRQPTLTTNE